MKLHLLVIRTKEPLALKNQYELLELTFIHHQHGSGPFHYSTENEGTIFEIYPLRSVDSEADSSLRLGFEVENLTSLVQTLKDSNWTIVSGIQETEWGKVAIVQDLDGRKVELKSK